MYTGIIQDAQFVGPGSYLRRKVAAVRARQAAQLGTNLAHHARRDATRSAAAAGCTARRPAQLVAHLAHPNGWWRDTAQKLLVLKQDKSVVPALKAMAPHVSRISSRAFTRCGRSRAWAALDASLVRELLKDRDPQIRIQAIRASESLYKASRRQDVRAPTIAR